MKTPETANLQDLQMAYGKRLCQLGHALPATDPLFQEAAQLFLESTFATLTNVNFDDARFEQYLRKSDALAKRMEVAVAKVGAVPNPAPDLPSRLPTNLQQVASPTGLLARGQTVGSDNLFGVLEMATYGLKGVSAYMYHAENMGGVGAGGYSAAERDAVFAELFRIGAYLAQEASVVPADVNASLGGAVGECMAVGKVNLEVMRLLDSVHNKALGTPTMTEVTTGFTSDKAAILVSGHDMGVLRELLAQCEGKNVDVYTHSEMLPAHSYPGLKKFKALKGHFGTHWGNQLQEFREFPGAILVTSNCIRPPTKRYKDRLWTTGAVGWPGVPYVEDDDFADIIGKAQQIHSTGSVPKPSSEGRSLLTGFGHATVLSVADKVLEAIKAGQVKHVFVIGGCDGTEGSRSYFTELARKTPDDALILTLGCGKFKINQEDHGLVGGLPKLLDMGQCNDAYSAVVVAVKLAEALDCTVHDLPLHLAVSWLEQKAVAVLLTLLHLELKNIRIGPGAPGFVSDGVAGVLNEKFGLSIAGNVDDDLAKMLQGQ
jgi:hydroxylamine reductase